MKPSSIFTFLVLLDQLILPAIVLVWMIKKEYKRKMDWVFQFLFTASFFLYIYTISRWDYFCYYLRYYWIALFLFTSYVSYKKTKATPFFARMRFKDFLLSAFIICFTVILSMVNFSAIKGYSFQDKPLNLEFPLNTGKYYVLHGGNNAKINYHQSYDPQKYALDIVKLNTFGLRAKGITPKELSRYEIYQDILFAPCDGVVIKAAGHLPDMVPPDKDKINPMGNFIAMKHDDTMIYLAHMMKGSLIVKKGDRVKKGQPIGKVGNSGNSGEPHLHIHAVKNSQAVPITFNGKFMVRNSVF